MVGRVGREGTVPTLVIAKRRVNVMKYTICNKCGTNLPPNIGYCDVRIDRESYDLCKDCAKKTRDFVKRKD